MQLADDDSWLDNATNCLFFGASGVGKTHLALGLAHAMLRSRKTGQILQCVCLSSTATTGQTTTIVAVAPEEA